MPVSWLDLNYDNDYLCCSPVDAQWHSMSLQGRHGAAAAPPELQDLGIQELFADVPPALHLQEAKGFMAAFQGRQLSLRTWLQPRLRVL